MPPFSILVIDEDPDARQAVRLCLEVEGARVVGVGSVAAGLEALERGSFDAVLLDFWIGGQVCFSAQREIHRRRPRLPILVTAASPTPAGAVAAMKHGAVGYLGKPLDPDEVRGSTILAIAEASRAYAPAPPEAPEPGLAVRDAAAFFASASPAFCELLALVDRAAASGRPLLLRGESGTGKTVIARRIHAKSPRRNGPFVGVACPVLTRDLMGTTLFGHKRGAFTGAIADTTGKVQEAEGGTLFLDEIGDLEWDLQTRILCFLDDGAYERVGDQRARRADVRLIAATNRPLEDDVLAKRFREDLLFRLNVIPLVLPPLRERREDLLPLARHYLAPANAGRSRPLVFSLAALEAIQGYPWPGNLRELQHAVDRAVALVDGDVIEPANLGLAPAKGAGAAVALGADVTIAALEREHIARVLARGLSLDEAARILGISRSTLHRKRVEYGLI